MIAYYMRWIHPDILNYHTPKSTEQFLRKTNNETEERFFQFACYFLSQSQLEYPPQKTEYLLNNADLKLI